MEKILSDLESEPIPANVSELSILITDDEEVQQLNRDYRDKDKPTDVLSFSQLEELEPVPGVPADLPRSLGDLVISFETAELQAEEFKVSLSEEILRLLTHGILHLHGYDHENVPKEEELRMREKEASILKEIGEFNLLESEGE